MTGFGKGQLTSMAPVDTEVRLGGDIAALRALIDSLLDEGRGADDPILIASSLVLSARLAELRRRGKPEAASSARCSG